MRWVTGQEWADHKTLWQYAWPVWYSAEGMAPWEHLRRYHRPSTVEEVRRDQPDNPLIKPGPIAEPPRAHYSIAAPEPWRPRFDEVWKDEGEELRQLIHAELEAAYEETFRMKNPIGILPIIGD